MDKASEAVNQLQTEKTPQRYIAIRDWALTTRQGQSETTIHAPAQYLGVNHNTTRLKQPVGQKNSDGSLKIDIMISQIFKCFSSYLHSIDSLLVIELIIDHIHF